MTTYKIAVIGDVHWGAMPPTHLEEVFTDCVLPWLENNEVDAIIQVGDWFDQRIALDSNDAKCAVRIITLLAQLAERKNVPFRIIKGTLSHDYFQLQNYHPLETEYSQFRVISTAHHEELLPGFDVLWVPEEYPTDYSDYYGALLFNEDGDALVYDAMFGHGEIDVAAGWSAVNEGERHYGGTPCHAVETLFDHTSGPIWFGHIHNRFRHKKRLGYPGSLTRWCQGEEAPKGFDVLTITEKKAGGWDVKADVVDNTLAPIYRTVVASEFMDASYSVDQIVDAIREQAEDVYKLRVKMLDFPISVEDLSVVRGALVQEHHIDIVTSARAINETTVTPIDGEENVEDTAQREATVERLSYLRDPLIPGEDRLLRYLHEKFPERSDVTIEEVRELTAPLVS